MATKTWKENDLSQQLLRSQGQSEKFDKNSLLAQILVSVIRPVFSTRPLSGARTHPPQAAARAHFQQDSC